MPSLGPFRFGVQSFSLGRLHPGIDGQSQSKANGHEVDLAAWQGAGSLAGHTEGPLLLSRRRNHDVRSRTVMNLGSLPNMLEPRPCAVKFWGSAVSLHAAAPTGAVQHPSPHPKVKDPSLCHAPYTVPCCPRQQPVKKPSEETSQDVLCRTGCTEASGRSAPT